MEERYSADISASAMTSASTLHRPLVASPDQMDWPDDDIEAISRSSTTSWKRPCLRRRRPSAVRTETSRAASRCLMALTLLCVSVLSAWGGILYQSGRSLDAACAAHSTQWSPVLRDVAIEYQPHQFNGSFMHEDIYRQVGSDAVDAAWEALGVDYRAGIISREDGLRSGLSDHFVQRADKYGGGFMVNVEGMHHLHCLNLVRKALYFNYDRYKALGHHAFQNDEDILRLHVTHCLDTVRQVLMCNVDTGVLGQVWVDPEEPQAFPDFNTRHVCKNFDDVRAWAEKMQAPPSDDTPWDYLAEPKSTDFLPAIP